MNKRDIFAAEFEEGHLIETFDDGEWNVLSHIIAGKFHHLETKINGQWVSWSFYAPTDGITTKICNISDIVDHGKYYEGEA